MHMNLIFQMVLVGVGFVGNVLSIAVWSRKSMRSSTGIYFMGHGFVNIGFLLSFFLTHGILELLPNVDLTSSYGAFFAYAGFPMFNVFLVCSIWFTVGVAVDRYIWVCWINKAKKLCSPTHSLVYIGTITALSVLVNVPQFLTYEVTPVEELNVTDVAYRLTSFGESEFAEMYELWIHCLALVVIPWILIFSLNILIILRVKDVGKKVAHHATLPWRGKTRKFENQLTGTLMLVSFTFLTLTLLQCASQCVYMMDKVKDALYEQVFSSAKLSLVLYMSVNFFQYCLCSKRFRVELRDLVCSRCCSYNNSFIVETLNDEPTSAEIESAPAMTALSVEAGAWTLFSVEAGALTSISVEAGAEQSPSESGVLP